MLLLYSKMAKWVFQILTNYSGDTLNTLFQPVMYYKDTPGNKDSMFFVPRTSYVNVPKYNTGLHTNIYSVNY
jgi:hypothetical protein